MFYPAAMNESVQSLLTSPRFIGIFIRDIVGLFGMQGMIVFLIFINAINITLTILLVKEATKIKLYWPTVILFLFLIFSHPGFYINYTYDFFDAMAYFFAILSICFWYKLIKSFEYKYIYSVVGFLFLSIFSKETYFIPLLVFFISQWFSIHEKKQRQYVSIVLGVIILFFVASVLHSKLFGSPWVRLTASNNDSYYVDFNLVSIINVYAYYLSTLANAGVIGLIAVSFISSMFLKRRYKEIFVILVIGLSIYLPYALLPNHKFSYYWWLAVPLTYSVILFIQPDTLKEFVENTYNKRVRTITMLAFGIVIVFLGALSFKNYVRSYADPLLGLTWILKQENINRNMLSNLSYIKDIVSPSDHVLLVGLTFPFHPYSRPNYIDSYFGVSQKIKWVVATYDEANMEGVIGSIEYIRINRIDLSKYEKIIEFDSEGNLIKILDGINDQANVGNLNVVTEKDAILYPELNKYVGFGAEDYDWYQFMQIGNIFAKNFPIKAEYFFGKAIQLSNNSNPYPYFYMGQFKEGMNNKTEALYDYTKAVELDNGNNKNTPFEEAFIRLKTKL
jgi:hypothetical protein